MVDLIVYCVGLIPEVSVIVRLHTFIVSTRSLLSATPHSMWLYNHRDMPHSTLQPVDNTKGREIPAVYSSDLHYHTTSAFVCIAVVATVTTHRLLTRPMPPEGDSTFWTSMSWVVYGESEWASIPPKYTHCPLCLPNLINSINLPAMD